MDVLVFVWPQEGRKKKKHHDWDRDLSTDLDRIRNVFGCDVLVSLIRHSELQDLKIQQLFQEVEARGMDYIHFPIKDKWIPHSMDDLIKNIDHIIQLLKKGKTVVCHCNGGKGRSGTVIVATLVGLGHKVQNAIDIVRKARSGTIRNPLQIMYVKRFKNAWLQYVKKKFDDGTEGLGTISEEEVEDIPDVEGGLADKEGLSEKVSIDGQVTQKHKKKDKDKDKEKDKDKDKEDKEKKLEDKDKKAEDPEKSKTGGKKVLKVLKKERLKEEKVEKRKIKEAKREQRKVEKLIHKEEKYQKKLVEIQKSKFGKHGEQMLTPSTTAPQAPPFLSGSSEEVEEGEAVTLNNIEENKEADPTSAHPLSDVFVPENKTAETDPTLTSNNIINTDTNTTKVTTTISANNGSTNNGTATIGVTPATLPQKNKKQIKEGSKSTIELKPKKREETPSQSLDQGMLKKSGTGPILKGEGKPKKSRKERKSSSCIELKSTSLDTNDIKSEDDMEELKNKNKKKAKLTHSNEETSTKVRKKSTSPLSNSAAVSFEVTE